jgi:hypothetical protein
MENKQPERRRASLGVPQEAKTRSDCSVMTDSNAGWRDVARSDHRNHERRAIKRQINLFRAVEIKWPWKAKVVVLAERSASPDRPLTRHVGTAHFLPDLLAFLWQHRDGGSIRRLIVTSAATHLAAFMNDNRDKSKRTRENTFPRNCETAPERSSTVTRTVNLHRFVNGEQSPQRFGLV